MKISRLEIKQHNFLLEGWYEGRFFCQLIIDGDRLTAVKKLIRRAVEYKNESYGMDKC